MKLRSSNTTAKLLNTSNNQLINENTATASSAVSVRRSTRPHKEVNYNIRNLQYEAFNSVKLIQSDVSSKKHEKRKLPAVNLAVKRCRIQVDSLASGSSAASKGKNESITINMLSDNVMVIIFERLSMPDRIRIEQVCRRWRILSKFSWSKTDNFSYESLYDIHTFNRYSIQNSHVGDIIRRAGRFLKHVDLSSFRESLTHDVCRFFVNTVKLQLIDLNGIHLTNSALSKLAHYCPNLKSVNFARCFQNTSMERGLSDFLSVCNQLEYLDLSENENLRGITSFSRLPHSLKNLNVEGCYKIDVKAFSNIRDRCPNLVAINLNRVDLLNSETLNSLFENLVKLETLKFGQFYVPSTLNGTDLIALNNLRSLKNLLLCDNNLINDQALIAITRGCINLENLDISGCNKGITEDGLRLLGNLPSLKCLNVSCSRIFTDICLKDVARRGNLKEINMHRCVSITDEGVEFLLSKCNSLVKLDVSFCSGITSKTVQLVYEVLNKRHGNQLPMNTNDENIFHLSIRNSGITPFENKSPWLNVIQDYERTRLPVFINLDRRGGVLRWERIMHVLIHYHNIFDL